MKLPEVNVTFSGCGFLGLYHVGSMACWGDRADRVKVRHALGASSGAIVAAGVALQMPADTIRQK